MKDWNILLVDDDAMVLRVHKDLLTHMGYRVVSFISPVDALAYIDDDSNDVDMLLTDFKMPELDGLELAHRVRKAYPELPILILSAFADDPVFADAAQNCQVDVMCKPAPFKQFRARIEMIRALKAAGVNFLSSVNMEPLRMQLAAEKFAA